MDDRRGNPPFPGPLGPPGEVESLLHLTLGRVNETDLRAIAAADYAEREDEVLALLRIPRREHRWPAVADAGEDAFALHECCSLVLTATERGIGGPDRWRLLFALGVAAHLTCGPGWTGDSWAAERSEQLLALSTELGPEAVAAARPFAAWLREHLHDPEVNEWSDFDLGLLILDAATTAGTPATDARADVLWADFQAWRASARGIEGPPPANADWLTELHPHSWWDDIVGLYERAASAALAMAPAPHPPKVDELLRAMADRREPEF